MPTVYKPTSSFSKSINTLTGINKYPFISWLAIYGERKIFCYEPGQLSAPNSQTFYTVPQGKTLFLFYVNTFFHQYDFVASDVGIRIFISSEKLLESRYRGSSTEENITHSQYIDAAIPIRVNQGETLSYTYDNTSTSQRYGALTVIGYEIDNKDLPILI